MALDTPRARYFAILGVRLLGALGALLGVWLVAKAPGAWTKGLGVALVLSAIYMTATVSAALAQRWRSPSA